MIKIVFTVFVSCIAVLTLPVSAGAQSDSSLQQDIVFIDCTATSVPDGNGASTTSTECDGAIAPTIDSIETTSGRPVITGTFDAQRTKELRCKIGGRTYILGINSELTASGNRWKLDLSNLEPPLTIGVYNLIVETITYDGLMLRDGSLNEVVIEAPEDTPGGEESGEGNPENPSQGVTTPGAPNTGFERVKNTLFSLAALLAMSLVVLVVVAVLRRTDKRD